LAEFIKIPIRPGGMNRDQVENDLGFNEFYEVKNLRQNKIGEWECVKGYLNHFAFPPNGNNIKAATEITDDLSGDRFILFQDGTNLKRLDYDAGDGNGYENETPSTLTLPSGVTIGAAAVLRFFYFRGVVRISGASVPLWYGYINRTLFEDAWKQIALHTFEGGTESWSANNATLSKYDCDVDGDSAGMWGAPEKANALKVVQTANTGSARQSFTVRSGKDIRIVMYSYRHTGTGDLRINVGSSAGGTQYGQSATSINDDWVRHAFNFTATGTTVYVELMPSAGAANDTAYFDFIFIEENCPLEIVGWYLEKAEVVGPTFSLMDEVLIDGGDHGLVKTYTVFDDAQYSLPIYMNSGDEIINGVNGLDIKIEGNNLDAAANFPKKRLTRVGVILAVADKDTYNEDTITYYIDEDIPLNDGIQYYTATREKYYYDATYPNRLYFTSPGTGVGKKIDGFLTIGLYLKIKKTSGTMRWAEVVEVKENDYFELSKSIYRDLSLIGADTDQEVDVVIQIQRKWTYDTMTGYQTRVGADFSDLGANEFYDYADIPAGTTDTNPDYTHHIVSNDRGMCLSGEDEEEDVIRVSPINQFDVFPNTMFVQTQVGDRDRNLALVRLANKFVILKRNSISQGQYQGSSYYEDIGLANNGLYATNGYIVINDNLYFMDKDDVYLFYGIKPMPLLKTTKMRQYYIAYRTTASFMGYNKLDNELWLFLTSSKIMVYHFEREAWYIRETSLTPVTCFLDSDNQFIVAAAQKIVNYNHSATTFAEEVNWSFTTRIIDLQTPEYYKKLADIFLFIKSSGAVAVTGADENESISYSDSGTPETAKVANLKFNPKYMFRELKLTVAGSAAAANKHATIERCDIRIQAWRRENGRQ